MGKRKRVRKGELMEKKRDKGRREDKKEWGGESRGQRRIGRKRDRRKEGKNIKGRGRRRERR